MPNYMIPRQSIDFPNSYSVSDIAVPLLHPLCWLYTLPPSPSVTILTAVSFRSLPFMLYIKRKFLPHREHAIKLCTEIISIYCNNHTKYINVLCSKMQISNLKAYQHLLKRQSLHSFISCERSAEPWSSITTIDSFITYELPTAADLVPRSLLRVVLDSMQHNTLLDVKSRSASKHISRPPPNPTPPFMEHDRSLTYSYDPVTVRYSEPDQSTRHTICLCVILT